MNPTEPTIRISREEATSSHVDDLLKRQMSLRGEAGISRDKGRRWFYQNWFIFMLAGIFAAIAAWAIIKPFFNDLEFTQGPIKESDFEATIARHLESEGESLDLRVPIRGWIRIKGERIWLLEHASEILPDGKKRELDPATLRIGQTVGAYVEYHEFHGNGVALGACRSYGSRISAVSHVSLAVAIRDDGQILWQRLARGERP